MRQMVSYFLLHVQCYCIFPRMVLLWDGPSHSVIVTFLCCASFSEWVLSSYQTVGWSISWQFSVNIIHPIRTSWATTSGNILVTVLRQTINFKQIEQYESYANFIIITFTLGLKIFFKNVMTTFRIRESLYTCSMLSDFMLNIFLAGVIEPVDANQLKMANSRLNLADQKIVIYTVRKHHSISG